MMVQSVRHFQSFEAILHDLGVKTCVLGTTPLSQSVDVHHSFQGYAEKASKFGIVGMELKKPGSFV